MHAARCCDACTLCLQMRESRRVAGFFIFITNHSSTLIAAHVNRVTLRPTNQLAQDKIQFMRQYLFLITLMFSGISGYAQTDEDAIKQVIHSAYIEGIQNRGTAEQIREGFHPSFNMLRLIENEVKPLPIEEWISNIEKAKAKGDPTPAKTEGKFINVDVTGNAAVVKLELYRENKKTFTDYLVLYKFAEGWKIVSKTFQRH